MIHVLAAPAKNTRTAAEGPEKVPGCAKEITYESERRYLLWVY